MRNFFIFVLPLMALGFSSCKWTEPSAEAPSAPTAPIREKAGDPSEAPPASDCVRWGCSNQLCGDAAEVSGAISTCEWKEEYRCAQLMACGRDAEKRCALSATPESEKCFAEVKGAKNATE